MFYFINFLVTYSLAVVLCQLRMDFRHVWPYICSESCLGPLKALLKLFSTHRKNPLAASCECLRVICSELTKTRSKVK